MAAAVMSSSRGGRGSAYRPMHYGYGNSDNEPGGMAQSLMALIGLVMAGGGIYLLITSALHPREVLPPPSARVPSSRFPSIRIASLAEPSAPRSRGCVDAHTSSFLSPLLVVASSSRRVARPSWRCWGRARATGRTGGRSSSARTSRCAWRAARRARRCPRTNR